MAGVSSLLSLRPAGALLVTLAAWLLSSCGSFSSSPSTSDLVVLDIGHYVPPGASLGTGARTPGAAAGRNIEECRFWYQYAYDTKRVIEKAGYRCVVCNRGCAPTTEPLATYARRAGVVQLNKPDTRDKGGSVCRYASVYHPARISAGMVSADYAVFRNAACAVFLHHNSSSSRWRKTTNGVVYHNRVHGAELGSILAKTINRRVLNNGNMPNGGKNCTTGIRWIDGTAGAGWMNTCDDSGIPAALIEVAFLNNPEHARWLADDNNARRYAEAVGEGIVSFLRSR